MARRKGAGRDFALFSLMVFVVVGFICFAHGAGGIDDPLTRYAAYSWLQLGGAMMLSGVSGLWIMESKR